MGSETTFGKLDIIFYRSQSPRFLEEERKTHPQVQKVEESLRLTLSYKILIANFIELQNTIPADDSEFNFPQYQYKEYSAIQFREKVSRQIFNYVSSAKALVDHMRRLYNDLYTSVQMPEYSIRVKELASDPIVKFVNDLRNYVNHFHTLEIARSVSLTENFGIKTPLIIVPEKLLEYKKWNPISRKFLEERDMILDKLEEIPIIEVIEDYHGKISVFHQWFQEKQKEIHSDDLLAVALFDYAIKEHTIVEVERKIEEIASTEGIIYFLNFQAEIAGIMPIEGWEKVDQLSATLSEKFENILNMLIEYGCNQNAIRGAGERIKSRLLYGSFDGNIENPTRRRG